jgi:hypothetical protein
MACAAQKISFGPKLVWDSSTAPCKAESGFLPEEETKVLVQSVATGMIDSIKPKTPKRGLSS